MGLFKKKQPENTPITEEPGDEPLTIRYVGGGGGKGSQGRYFIGENSIPASLVSRVQKACQGKSDMKQGFVIHSALEKKYASALDAFEAMGISFPEALRKMIELKPIKSSTSKPQASRIEKTAQMLAKVACKRWKGTESEISSAFFESIQGAEMKAELSKAILGFEASFGHNLQGFVKTSDRVGPFGVKEKAIMRK